MAKESLKNSLFITFEGIEGCGKSTHSKLLFDHLKKIGFHCVHTREPGGTKLGEAVRKVLLGSKTIHISDMTELFLFEACRAQIVKEIIRPALERRNVVICDRFSDATLTYQGHGGKIDPNVIKKLDHVSTGGLKPDLTILLDIDVLKGLARARRKGVDRMESKDVAYHKRVRAGYLKLAKEDPRRIKIIKVKGSIAKVQNDIRNEVDIVICRSKRPG